MSACLPRDNGSTHYSGLRCSLSLSLSIHARARRQQAWPAAKVAAKFAYNYLSLPLSLSLARRDWIWHPGLPIYIYHLDGQRASNFGSARELTQYWRCIAKPRTVSLMLILRSVWGDRRRIIQRYCGVRVSSVIIVASIELFGGEETAYRSRGVARFIRIE